ncbi:MAG: DUF2802 domain-containing protein [Proteobacteria bacterium]|nr:DUF2802 domain-containing protein [Pseudomonadota bacterium]
MRTMMMQYSPEEWLQLGRAAFLVFSFLLAALAFRAWRRAAHRQGEQAATQHAETLRRLQDLDGALAAATALIGQLTESLERLTRADATGTRPSGYPIAIRLARGGATAAELVSTCGISSSEADLVCRLHGAPRVAHA